MVASLFDMIPTRNTECPGNNPPHPWRIGRRPFRRVHPTAGFARVGLVVIAFGSIFALGPILDVPSGAVLGSPAHWTGGHGPCDPRRMRKFSTSFQIQLRLGTSAPLWAALASIDLFVRGRPVRPAFFAPPPGNIREIYSEADARGRPVPIATSGLHDHRLERKGVRVTVVHRTFAP